VNAIFGVSDLEQCREAVTCVNEYAIVELADHFTSELLTCWEVFHQGFPFTRTVTRPEPAEMFAKPMVLLETLLEDSNGEAYIDDAGACHPATDCADRHSDSCPKPTEQ
jgi:hypothetical protein